MSAKKWFLMFLAALCSVLLLWGGFNLLTDPFNAFGDPVLGWDSYTQTLNPRISKTVYLSEHLDQYDSYVIGSSSAASYLPETLNQALDASFYNMFHYGADTGYDRQLVSYLLEADDVRHIVLVLGLNEANLRKEGDQALTDRAHYAVSGENPVSFYADLLFASPNYGIEKLQSLGKDTRLPQSFDVFLPESGTYDKRVRDAEPIGALSAYRQKNGGDFAAAEAQTALNGIDACIADVAAIRDLCAEAGAELTVILSPVTAQQRSGYTDATLNEYFEKLAQTVDYWNFALSAVSGDERYFYDTTHTRNDTAAMVLAQVFDLEGRYYPEDFGRFYPRGSQPLALEAQPEAVQTRDIPILLYHHLDPATESGTTLTPDRFRHQMELLKEHGYQTVGIGDLIAYVEQGTPLPEKAVVVSFDDGYLSNYQYAYPILRELDYQAVVFAIGCSVGHGQYYKDTAFELTPHFGEAELAEMTASGVMALQSHTYDLHQWAPFESGSPIRQNLLPLAGESQEEYYNLLAEDSEKQHQLFASLGLERSIALAFPGGARTDETNVFLKELGYKVTLSTDHTRVNTLVPGLSQSLLDLGRMNVDPSVSDAALLQYCGG